MTAAVWILDFSNVDNVPVAPSEGDTFSTIAREVGRRQRAKQGLPRRIEDLAALERLAALMKPRERRPVPSDRPSHSHTSIKGRR